MWKSVKRKNNSRVPGSNAKNTRQVILAGCLSGRAMVKMELDIVLINLAGKLFSQW